MRVRVLVRVPYPLIQRSDRGTVLYHIIRVLYCEYNQSYRGGTNPDWPQANLRLGSASSLLYDYRTVLDQMPLLINDHPIGETWIPQSR